ncbi:prolyl oligopeptidase family serine peptidase [Microbacterium sp. 18062]|uniref:S9 family peptidase n=1 Tax=Microbacterium sp. 18062 TaxID=2681410 RepID=UPI001359F1E6|nr:prolyl oligopeptidase family serine peptidase [Microbacterium sp. 18062]
MSTTEDRTIPPTLAEHADRLVEAWSSWGPTMTPEADRVAFISDRGGQPSVWVQVVPEEDELPEAVEIAFTDDPVVAVSWSADSAWLACAVATDGGVRQQVWVVRPDGRDARRIAGSEHIHAELGPWTRSGHRVVVTIPPVEPGDETYAYLADPLTGELHALATGQLISVLDLSAEERLAVLRDGRRGRHFCVGVDRLTDTHRHLLPATATGTTESAIIRPAPPGAEHPLTTYLVTDIGRDRRQLVAAPLGHGPDDHGMAGEDAAAYIAARPDAELDEIDADDAGGLLVLVWNVAGATELELLDPATGERERIDGLPGTIATDVVMSRDGRSILIAVESAHRPRTLWRFEVVRRRWSRVTTAPAVGVEDLATPSLERFRSEDGLEITGWLYRGHPDAAPDAAGRALVWLHGGPEAQERPGFSAQHQAFVAAGISVFALNVRGSSGFGREFVHADEGSKREGAFADVRAAAAHLVALGIAEPGRIAVGGRSYGGYLTLALLAFSPGVFAAGIDVCGMSDLRTFYRDTEPWIAAAAYPKYGHPTADRRLLKRLSPLREADAIDVPLLVVHGELDTNVPIGEARQIVRALRRRGRPVEYLQLQGEGHEYRRLESRRRLLRRMLAFAASALPE